MCSAGGAEEQWVWTLILNLLNIWMCLKEPVVHILKNVEEMLMTKATTF